MLGQLCNTDLERTANMSETDFQEKNTINPRLIFSLLAINNATDIFDR
jgi:hypothetical protein